MDYIHNLVIPALVHFLQVSFQRVTLGSGYNVEQNILEFKRTIPRRLLHPKRGKSC
ncbi:hypothetical protein [Wolbachia endosymbiont of Ctenocephalides felis wCfeJ]|uniref:hypothetical protein n=1 Tax=Wolbachia endosymbiont of Ctenocephalides felis wCfeJ TaxID=2732594 RepID=UPI0014481157|nr:hypothetical protein [Wolbachia endosymbiont of Ctenocephalides felis wCfeJ]